MSRLTIDITEQQHQALKASAALQGKTIKQYVLERLLPSTAQEQEALQELRTLLAERIAQVQRGERVEGSISDIADDELRRRA